VPQPGPVVHPNLAAGVLDGLDGAVGPDGGLEGADVGLIDF
jgi:hypothetical protein